MSAKELRVQLIALAAVTWVYAAFNVFTPDMHYRTGSVKGADFIHFYVLGNLAADGRGDVLYDAEAQRAEQSRLVPASRGYWFTPIYGPQTALLFAGLARLPYLDAALAWAAMTALLYGACMWVLWRRCAALGPHRTLLVPAALGFTPFYVLVLCGQTSVVPMACLTLGYLALRADSPWWAGAALGSLVFKPQLGLAVAVVMVARREWRIIGGAIAAVAVQWGVPVLVFGPGPLLEYFGMIRQGPRLAAALEPDPDLLHSLRAFWTLICPRPDVALALYVASGAAVLALAVRLWRASVPLEVRYSALVLATILVSPHVGSYELVLLAPALVLTAAHAEESAVPRRRLLRVVLYVAYLIPITGTLTATIRLQLSVPVMAAWLVILSAAAIPFADTLKGSPGAAHE